VRKEFLDLPTPPDLNGLPLSTAVPDQLPPLTGYAFDGYPTTADRPIGLRPITSFMGLTKGPPPVTVLTNLSNLEGMWQTRRHVWGQTRLSPKRREPFAPPQSRHASCVPFLTTRKN
jgi:hypothetical protein